MFVIGEHPIGEGWKESIGLFGRDIDLCEIEFVGKGHGLLINRSAANDEHFGGMST